MILCFISSLTRTRKIHQRNAKGKKSRRVRPQKRWTKLEIHEIWCKIEQSPSKWVNYKSQISEPSAVSSQQYQYCDCLSKPPTFSPFKSMKQIYGGWMGFFRSHFKFTSSRCFTISYFANILSSPNTHNPPSLPSTFSTSPINRALFFANFSTPRVSVGH